MAHPQEQDRRAGGGQDQEITRENLDHQPPGHARNRRQRDVHSAQEDLVGDRIEVCADVRSHAEAPRQGTVEGVGEPPEQNDRQRPPVLLSNDGVNGEWNTRQPHEREQVRDVEPAGHPLTIVRDDGVQCGTIPGNERPNMRLRILTLALTLAAGGALAQRHQLGTVNAETPEGQLLQQIGQAPDEAKKLALMEQFAAQSPKHEAIGWVYEQMQSAYVKAGPPDKVIEIGEKLLAMDAD